MKIFASNIKVAAVLPVILLSLGIAGLQGQTNHTEISITTSATNGGSFTGTAPNRVFTLTPGVNTANIQASVLQTELLTSNVTINTANTGANGNGTVTFSTAVTAASTATDQKTFTVTAGGGIRVLFDINLTPSGSGGSKIPPGPGRT